jgi:hypothetical protein
VAAQPVCERQPDRERDRVGHRCSCRRGTRHVSVFRRPSTPAGPADGRCEAACSAIGASKGCAQYMFPTDAPAAIANSRVIPRDIALGRAAERRRSLTVILPTSDRCHAVQGGRRALSGCPATRQRHPRRANQIRSLPGPGSAPHRQARADGLTPSTCAVGAVGVAHSGTASRCGYLHPTRGAVLDLAQRRSGAGPGLREFAPWCGSASGSWTRRAGRGPDDDLRVLRVGVG